MKLKCIENFKKLFSHAMICIENLLKKYDEKIALNHLSMKIEAGVIFGLLGPNGAGKTTLISILNGLSDFQGGEVSLFGLPLRENIKSIRRRCSLIPQALAFYENLTVLENLHFFAGIQNISRSELKKNSEYAIETSRLGSMLGQKANTLSGGQKRRLNLAIGLLNNPDILFFDEPTVGIDPEARNEILDTIVSFKRENKTVIYTSHYMPEIEKICDEVAIIDSGKILAQGALSEILKEENSFDVVIEIYETSLQQLQMIASDFDYLSVIDTASLMIRDHTSSKVAEILARLELESVAIRQIHYGTNSLESFFIHLTSKGRADD